MEFSVRPVIRECSGLQEFFTRWNVGEKDIIITNNYILSPALAGARPPCDVLYQEEYGHGEPSDEMLDGMLSAIEGREYGRIIAIGGGTVIDASKLFVFGGGMDIAEIFNKGAALPRKRSLIIIPTTCGTGSEVTGISIVEFKKKRTKIGLAVPALFADEAVLIPAMLATLPYEVFATSSIDALIHAVESYASPKANAFTCALGRSAIEQIVSGYQKLAQGCEQTLPGEIRDFLVASTMAGIAFGNAGCAAVHALSYPIGGGFHLPHGKANYLVFSAVFEAYRAKGANLTSLEKTLAGALYCSIDQVWPELFTLLSRVLACPSLSELGVDEAKCAEMAASVIQNQQRLLANNPVALSEEDIKNIYLSCL